MKPLRDTYTKNWLVIMWLGLGFTAVVMLINSRPLSVVVTFIVGIGIAYSMGCARANRPWREWQRLAGHSLEKSLIRVKREGEKLHDSSSITRFDELRVVRGKEEVLISIIELIDPERRLPRDDV